MVWNVSQRVDILRRWTHVMRQSAFGSANRKHEDRPYGAEQARKLRNGRKSDEGILSGSALRCLLSTVKFGEEVRFMKIGWMWKCMQRIPKSELDEGLPYHRYVDRILTVTTSERT